MTRGVRRGLVLVALLAAGWAGWRLWNTDARVIERRLAKLEKLAGKSVAETQFQAAGKARAIADLFAADFELIAEPESYATSNRQDLIRGVVAYRSRSRTLVIDTLRKELFVDPGGASAVHYGYVRFVTDLGDLVGSEVYPVRIEWTPEGGAWKVKKLEVLAEDETSRFR